jgi:uncharacterized protein (DUF1697 family)
LRARTSAVDRATGDVATYIGLLRAVNLPGHNKIAMADLRDVLTRLVCEML